MRFADFCNSTTFAWFFEREPAKRSEYAHCVHESRASPGVPPIQGHWSLDAYGARLRAGQSFTVARGAANGIILVYDPSPIEEQTSAPLSKPTDLSKFSAVLAMRQLCGRPQDESRD